MSTARRLAFGAAAAAGVGVWALRRTARRWTGEDGDLAAAGLLMPDDAVHHHLAASDGGKLHVVERGSGPPLLLLHGVTLGVAVWAPQLAGLADRHRVVAPDLRGHGHSVAGAAGYTFERLADDVLDVLEALDLLGTTVVGHSMGGMVALTAALHRREAFAARVARLVLVGTSAGPNVPGPGAAELARLLETTASPGLRYADRHHAPVVPSAAVAWLARLSFGVRPEPAEVNLAASLLAEMSPSALSGLLGPLLTFDLTAEVPSLGLPVDVVAGDRDLLVLPRTARRFAGSIPGARLTTLHGCGHMVMLERAEELAAVLSAGPPPPARSAHPGPVRAVRDRTTP